MTVRARAGALPGTVLLLGAVLLVGCASPTTGEGGGGLGQGPWDEAPTIRMARADWDTGHFQAAIHRQLLEELGYTVTDPAEATMSADSFYPVLARGDLDLWANGWFPLHEPYLERELVTGQRERRPVSPVGVQVPEGGVQGYLVDAATAAELEVTSMDDFTREEVIAAFDHDGDGRADLLGCEEEWGCRRVIDEHLATFEWGDGVEQRVGSYRAHLDLAERRVAEGEPVLYYTWTPNWTVEVLRPGLDVVWLEAPAREEDDQAAVPVELEGCAAGPRCRLGWPVNDLRAVANDDFLDAHPDVRRLLEQIEIPLVDIVAQNARMAHSDDYTDADISEDAARWIIDNRALVDEWLAAAIR